MFCVFGSSRYNLIGLFRGEQEPARPPWRLRLGSLPNGAFQRHTCFHFWVAVMPVGHPEGQHALLLSSSLVTGYLNILAGGVGSVTNSDPILAVPCCSPCQTLSFVIATFAPI